MRSRESIRALATENPHPKTQNLDRESVRTILSIMNEEDRQVPRAVQKAIPVLETLISGIAERLKSGGRLFYVGAGTSGRLGVLDASECPPTFGTKPSMVQGIIAGGPRAIRKAVEGAEDQEQEAGKILKRKKLSAKDCVIGISASGRTPFVLGALRCAMDKEALTAGITCNPAGKMLRLCRYPVVLPVGPEVLAGSSRLKCGTAQKLVLNMISTAVMIQLGRVKGNRMVDLIPKSHKLWERGKGLVMEALGISEKKAEALLKEAGGSVRTAIRKGSFESR